MHWLLSIVTQWVYGLMVLITSGRKGRPFLPSWIKAVTAIPLTVGGSTNHQWQKRQTFLAKLNQGCDCHSVYLLGGGVDQAYTCTLLSTTHGHITDCISWIQWCMQVYAWWFNVDLSRLGPTIDAWQFLGAKPPIQFRHRWAERNHSDHLCWLRAAQSDA